MKTDLLPIYQISISVFSKNKQVSMKWSWKVPQTFEKLQLDIVNISNIGIIQLLWSTAIKNRKLKFSREF